MNVIGQRMDLFAVGHAFGLIAVLSRRSRERIAAVWPKYCYFLSGILCFQYLLCIGFPPAACKGKKIETKSKVYQANRWKYIYILDYPWRPPSSNVDSNVVKWLFLPDHMTPPNPLFLLCKTTVDVLRPPSMTSLKAGGRLRSRGGTCSPLCSSR